MSLEKLFLCLWSLYYASETSKVGWSAMDLSVERQDTERERHRDLIGADAFISSSRVFTWIQWSSLSRDNYSGTLVACHQAPLRQTKPSASSGHRLHKGTCSRCAGSSVSPGLRSSQGVHADPYSPLVSTRFPLLVNFDHWVDKNKSKNNLSNRIYKNWREILSLWFFLNGHIDCRVQVIMSRIVILMAVILHVLCARGKTLFILMSIFYSRLENYCLVLLKKHTS